MSLTFILCLTHKIQKILLFCPFDQAMSAKEPGKLSFLPVIWSQPLHSHFRTTSQPILETHHNNSATQHLTWFSMCSVRHFVQHLQATKACVCGLFVLCVCVCVSVMFSWWRNIWFFLGHVHVLSVILRYIFTHMSADHTCPIAILYDTGKISCISCWKQTFEVNFQYLSVFFTQKRNS